MNALRTLCIERATAKTQDCLVVGAGINGAVTAAALAGKGARVTIIDKADFASFTTQESSNLAWGGIKYLETYEFGLVWNLCKCRNQLMKAYPTQVRETRFYTSVAESFRKPLVLIYLGALLYWLMGRCQTRPPRLLGRNTIATEAPMINTDALAGGLEYSDARFVENDARFAFGFIRKMLQKKCSAINYMELTAAEWKNGLWHCTLRDHESDETVPIKTKTLVNAAGPFADRINTMLGIDSPFKHVFSKGVHIIVPRVTRSEQVLTFFASDGRLFFMVPMGRRTCIGTTDTHVDNETAEPTDEDVAFLLNNANALLNLEKPLTVSDVISRRCGVRPLVVEKEADIGEVEWTALSRKHEVDLHPEKKMCTIYGGKLGDCLNVGEKVAGIVSSFGIPLYQPLKPWYGEPSKQKRARFQSECKKCGVDEKQISKLWRRYSKDAFGVLEKIRTDPTMTQTVLQDFIRAELHHMAEKEMVLHLDDFLRRRSMLALVEHRASLRCDPGLPEAAKILFGKNAATEIDRCFA